MIPRFILVVPILMLGMAGCAVRQPVLSHAEQAERAWLAQLSERGWRLTGRIGVRGGQGNWHGGLQWVHRADGETLTVSGPFGQGGVKIQIRGEWIRIRYQDGQIRESFQPEVLLEEIIGVRVPIKALHYWVLGLPVPGVAPARLQYNPLGRLQRLRQQGWQIEYLEYTAVPSGALPKKIVLTGPESVVLKLIVDRWESGVESRSA